jgi:hydrophobe/amphiphile efflux-1 (HAE1) family protein
VSAMTLSVLTAMVLTPALCATLLKPIPKGHHGTTTGFFGWFNRVFARGTHSYQGAVDHMLGRGKRYMVIYGVLTVLVAAVYLKVPGGFLPDEDQGTVYTMVQLPPGATQERTLKVLQQVEHHYLIEQKDAVDAVFTIAGFSFGGSGQNMGIAFVKMKSWNERKAPELRASGVTAKASAAFAKVRDASIFAFAPPAVSELGNASGFDLQLQDRANLGHLALMQARNQLLGLAMKEPGLVAVRPNGMDDTPEFQLDIDEHKAGTLGVALSDINDTFSTAWGSNYVNDFIDKGRVKKVFLQADAPYRMLPEDIDKWYVRNSAGSMVSFSAFANAGWASGSPRLERYNGLPSVEILGMAKPGTASSGEAMGTMERLAAQLPSGIGYEWTGISLQERQAGSQALMLYATAILIVFLCLAALYESWAIPLSVVLVVPLGVLGVLAAALLTWKLNDVYFQVGLLTTVGLSAKNAILIVEFAKELHEQGRSLAESALEAARMRLRPILMTSLAFILGVVPLAIGSGAGAGAQNALGTVVIGGMISATVLAIFFVPLFFVVVMRVFTRRSEPAPPASSPASEARLPLPENR